MELSLDPEYLRAIEPYLPVLSSAPKLPVGDIASRRAGADGLFDMLMEHWPEVDDVQRTNVTVTAHDGHQIPLHKFSRQGSAADGPGPAVFYCHGGGYFSLSVEHYRKVLELYVSKSGVPIFAVDYRLAPENPFPIPLNDCFQALKHLRAQADGLGVDPARIAVLGESAGGGLAAGLTIMARDARFDPPLAQQMLIGSMLDDRNAQTHHDTVNSLVTWSDADNLTGWEAYLGSNPGVLDADTISAAASPARVSDVAGLPPLYLEVPYIDIFRDENLAYASRVAAEGIDTEVHCWPGVPHSFELFAPRMELAQIAINLRVRCMTKL